MRANSEKKNHSLHFSIGMCHLQGYLFRDSYAVMQIYLDFNLS